MDLTWLDPTSVVRGDIDSAVALLEAARAVDAPHELALTASSYLAELRYGWECDPSVVALARESDGSLSAVLELHFPTWDNIHLGELYIVVDPLRRRRGIGRALFEIGMERLRAEGRRTVYADCLDESPGSAFAVAMGLERVYAEAQRHQHVASLDWAELDERTRADEGHTRPYELLRIAGPCPADLLDDLATLAAVINDAPMDDIDVEDEVYSPDRVKAFDIAQEARGRRVYRLLARHRDSREWAGQTVVGIEGDQPWFGSQWDTSVVRAHRGHRLGLALKIGMLRWLREEEPQLRVLDTWNALSNKQMIEVNETLGYQVVSQAGGYQRQF